MILRISMSSSCGRIRLSISLISPPRIFSNISKTRCAIVNDPVAVRNAPEKLLTTHFPHLDAAHDHYPRPRGDLRISASGTAISCSSRCSAMPVMAFFACATDDGNLHGAARIDGLAQSRAVAWCRNIFRRSRPTGDKRIVLLDGEPVGCFTRIPVKDDSRGNMRVGAKPSRRSSPRATARFAGMLAPVFKKQGLVSSSASM